MSKQVESRDLSFVLLENGLDFIASGLRYIARGETKSDLKYGVLHLASGIELVLKERLRQEDWRLVFVQPDKADERLYRAGNFRSVNQEECLNRLKEHCGIDLTDSQRETLRAFRLRRNRLEHFAIVDSQRAIERLAAEVLGILLDFIGEAFDESELLEGEDLLLEIRNRLGEFKRFTKSRLDEIGLELERWQKGYGGVIECPCCLYESLKADVRVECLFCGYRAQCEDAADFYIANHLGVTWASAMKDGQDYPRHRCPECYNEALVDLGPTGNAAPSTQFVCFSCGMEREEGALEICPYCQAAEDADSMTPWGCVECARAYMSRENT